MPKPIKIGNVLIDPDTSVIGRVLHEATLRHSNTPVYIVHVLSGHEKGSESIMLKEDFKDGAAEAAYRAGQHTRTV